MGKPGLVKKAIWWLVYLSGGSTWADSADVFLKTGNTSPLSNFSNQSTPSYPRSPGQRSSYPRSPGQRSSNQSSAFPRSSNDGWESVERFAVHEYDRKLSKIFLLLVGIDVLLFFFFGLYGLPLFAAMAVTLAAALVAYLVASVKVFSRDYEVQEVNGIEMIVPGPLFHFSLTGGRANDPFIDYENKMRTCLLQCHGMPEKMNDSTTHFECVDFDDERIVFRFYFQDVLGAYEFLKSNASRFAAEFGDPRGSEVTKIRDGVFEVVFNLMRTDFSSKANVRWSEE